MDFSPIIAPVWNVAIWLVPTLLLIGLLKSPWAKGHFGELLVRLLASWQLDKKTYRRLHNVTLNTPDGTTQIDHIILSPYGIFVIETKNMSGWIFGSEHQSQWTQRFPRSSFKFQNPLRQNYKHLKAVEATLDVSTEHLHSLITFIGRSSFKTEMPSNVTQGAGFIRYIKSFQQQVFSVAEVDTMLHTLRTGRLAPTFATHREHVQNLKRRSDPTTERQCPKCGSTLLIRAVKSGAKAGQQFWGCSAYPKCRTMQSL